MSAKIIDFQSIRPQGFNALSERNKGIIMVDIGFMLEDEYGYKGLYTLLNEKDKATIDRKISSLLEKQSK